MKRGATPKESKKMRGRTKEQAASEGVPDRSDDESLKVNPHYPPGIPPVP
jgi:hypothetical protein